MSKRRKKVKKKNRKIVWIIESLLFIILISLLVLLKIFNPQEREKIEEKSEETVKPLVIQTQQRKLDLDQLHSSAGIVISLDDSKVIFQFQQDEKIFPASLTKIMTCILAIENINNLEATITLEPEIFDELYAQNASMAGFLPGENAKIIDILYGNILPSGGECSIALAEYVAGSEQAFVELMNEKAKDLGMNNTHFMNATGLHNESHYTTVKDIGILLQYALKNQTFNDIEIILINDGSIDKSKDICNEYSEKDRRVKVIHKDNGGVSSARNFGLKIALGRYITFVDPDDYLDNDAIETLYELIIKYDSDIACYRCTQRED